MNPAYLILKSSLLATLVPNTTPALPKVCLSSDIENRSCSTSLFPQIFVDRAGELLRTVIGDPTGRLPRFVGVKHALWAHETGQRKFLTQQTRL
jgi:hypothetical protein